MDTITAKSTGSVSYAKPPEGQHQGVLVDVIDLGMHENTYQGVSKGMVHKCALVWQLEEVNSETGTRFEVSKEFTVSMGEKANLRKFLGAWRGKSYTDAEAEAGAPLHKLAGVNAMLTIEHKQSKSNPDRSYVNIISVSMPHKSMAKVSPAEYTRAEFWKERTHKEPVRPEDNGDLPAALQDEDDDLPF